MVCFKSDHAVISDRGGASLSLTLSLGPLAGVLRSLQSLLVDKFFLVFNCFLFYHFLRQLRVID